MAVLIKEADWAAVNEKMEPYGDEDLLVELTTDDEAAIEALAENEEVVVAADHTLGSRIDGSKYSPIEPFFGLI